MTGGDDPDDAFDALNAAQTEGDSDFEDTIEADSWRGEQDEIDTLGGDQVDATPTRARDGDSDETIPFETVACCRYCRDQFPHGQLAEDHAEFCSDRADHEQRARQARAETMRNQVPDADENGERYLIDPACHEFRAYLKYGTHTRQTADGETERVGEYGLEPYFALHALWQNHDWDESYTTSMQYDDREYSIEFTYNPDAPIEPWDDPDFRIENVREWTVKIRGPEEIRKATFKISPRWPDMEHVEDGKSGIANPRDLVGVDVDVKASNHDFEEYPALLDATMTALGVNGSSSSASKNYFDPSLVKGWSTIVDGELYVRIDEGHSTPLWTLEGPIERMGLLLADVHSGYREHVADDTECEGYRHVAAVGPDRAQELIDPEQADYRHHLAKQVKHYHMRDPDAQTGATEHPKLGVKFRNAIQRKCGGGTVYWRNLEDLRRELDEVLINVLRWAGLPVRPDHQVFVEDEVFDATARRRRCSIVPDPLPDLRDEQECKVLAQVRRMTTSDADVTRQILADGGTAVPKEIADETGWSYYTVLNALDRLEDIVRHDYNQASIRSQHIAEELLSRIDAVTENFELGVKKVKEQVSKYVTGLEDGSALHRWLERYDVEVDDPDDVSWKVLRSGYRPHDYEAAKEMLRDGVAAAMQSGLLESDLLSQARVSVTTQMGETISQRFAPEAFASTHAVT